MFATVELEWDADIHVTAVLDLSLGGALMELPPDLTADTGCEVVVHLSAGRHHTRQVARVIRITDRGFAVAWKSPTVETLTVLAVLLADEPTAAPEAERTTAGS